MAKGREKNRLRIRARCIMHEYTHQAAGGLRQLLLCQSAARVKLSFQLFERFFFCEIHRAAPVVNDYS